MSTSTFLWVNRRLEDNPQDTPVLLCNRMKTVTEEISPSLFVMRGTVESPEPTHIRRIAPNCIEQKTFVNDIVNKVNKQRMDFVTKRCYKVVNFKRRKKEKEQENEQNTNDLNTSAREDSHNISMLDNLVSIESRETELVSDNGLMESDVEDSEDSNAENYFKNDYADLDASSIDEDDNIEDDLSSDIDEDMIYDEPTEYSKEDAKRYGIGYAKYKARVLSEQLYLVDLNNNVFSTRMDDTLEYTYQR